MTNIVPFHFDEREVRTLIINGSPWFVVADVCAVLGLGNISEALGGTRKDRISFADVIDSIGRQKKSKIINESGLYRLILRSNKPDAERFQDWICDEVLPSIRKTGKFEVDVPFLLPVAQPWTKTFDDDFYANIFRLKGKTPVPRPKAPWLMQVTNDIVWQRLPDGVYKTLNLINPVLPGRKHRAKKQHQFVEPTVARRHLDRLLNRCIGKMSAYAYWDEFYVAWNIDYPTQRELPPGHVQFNFAGDQTRLFPFMAELNPKPAQ